MGFLISSLVFSPKTFVPFHHRACNHTGDCSVIAVPFNLSLSLIALLSYRSLYLFIHEFVSLFHLCLFLMLSLCCFRMVHAMAYSTMQRWEETVYVLCLLFFVSALKDDLSSHHYCFYFLVYIFSQKK